MELQFLGEGYKVVCKVPLTLGDTGLYKGFGVVTASGCLIKAKLFNGPVPELDVPLSLLSARVENTLCMSSRTFLKQDTITVRDFWVSWLAAPRI